jgi:DNA-binding transcriptional LysR family regulator
VIKHSDLVGFIPRPLALRAAKDITVVPVVEELPTLKIHAIIPAKAILTPAARALMSAIRASAFGFG